MQECFDFKPGKTLEIRSSLDWFGQSVQVAPSFAGSSVTFVWDGQVGPPGRPRGPHRDLTESKGNGEKPKEPKEPKKALGDVVYTVEVPSKEEWEDAGISALELKICTTRRPDATGLDIFNASGIPPSHAHINPAFERIAPLFNTTVQLPSHYARTPIRAGFFP